MFFKRAMSTSPVNKDVGLLLIRLGIGFSIMAFHGYDKIMGGPQLWAGVCGNMGPPRYWLRPRVLGVHGGVRRVRWVHSTHAGCAVPAGGVDAGLHDVRGCTDAFEHAGECAQRRSLRAPPTR